MSAGFNLSALTRTTSQPDRCRERGSWTASPLNAEAAKTTWEPAPEMCTDGCATEYGAPEAPVSGQDKLQQEPVRAWLTSWVEPREEPSRPKGERVFVLPRKEAGYEQ